MSDDGRMWRVDKVYGNGVTTDVRWKWAEFPTVPITPEQMKRILPPPRDGE